jgi:1-deoxy-D-xylulose-5-phosphate reductoisomerase
MLFGGGRVPSPHPFIVRRISILGSTGSIGRQCLNVVDSLPGQFEVVGLAGGSNVSLLAEQTIRHHPRVISAGSEDAVPILRELLRTAGLEPMPEILFGSEGILQVATHPDARMLLSAAVGVVGLPATFAAIQQGKDIALANKEVLVVAGSLVMPEVDRRGVRLLPVDSEHNAIHQCLHGAEGKDVQRLILTGSGGPFRKLPGNKFKYVTPEQALAHPNWRMGQRITVDSATLMNKGFEVIEAHWLFGVSLDRIDVVIHPQSTVHSMVEFVDGSVLAQLGPTDMRMPIQYALTYPERIASNGHRLDWAKMRKLEFTKVPARKFPCLRLAREALTQGGAYSCALNAADEVAVAAFLEGRLDFTGIPAVIESVLEDLPRLTWRTLQDVLAADSEARRMAREAVARRSH